MPIQAIASSNASLSAAAPGSLALQLQKGPQTNQVPLSGANHEIWAERNMADSSSRTDTSSDMDGDDRNQQFDMGQSIAAVASDSSDRSKEKNLDQKTLRRLAQNREAARKSRLRKKVSLSSNFFFLNLHLLAI
nr:TGACG-sequence-specific DNA-binding protein TGA-2.1-like [Ipomoea batatas]